jgi:N6-L-threonylcarbamoyladenine synthase
MVEASDDREMDGASRALTVLGVETSCDETAVAVVRGRRVLADVIATQIPLHRRFGGVVPEIASRNHLMAILLVVAEALARAGVPVARIDGVAVCNRPGLIGALLVGVQTARTLALCWRRPVVGIHHIQAHCWAASLQQRGDEPAPPLPFLALAVSGGHSSLYRVDGPREMQLLAQTLDDAAGEALDKFAKVLGLPYPGGPALEALAAGGDPARFTLPSGLRGRRAFSFSGLKTAGRLLAEESGATDPASPLRADLAASFQEAVVSQLAGLTLRVAREEGLRDLVLAGGVAANRRLRAVLAVRCERAGLGFWPAAMPFCTDNGAMVAGLGAVLLALGQNDDPHDLDAIPTSRPSVGGR